MNGIYNITLSIGKLNAAHIEPLYGLPVDKSLYKLIAESKNLRRWIDYGTLSDDEVTFYQDGESRYITIDGYTFDNRVYTHQKSVATQDTVNHTIKLNGSTPEGEIFEIKLYDELKDIHSIIKVIYAMTITSVVGIDRIEEYWKRLTRVENLNIEEIIVLVKGLKEIAAQTRDKFPFLSLFFQDAIHRYIRLGKARFDSFELFNE